MKVFQHPCLKAHVHALKNHEADYLKNLTEKMDTLSSAVKGCAFAALHLSGNHKALNNTIKHWDIASLYKMFVYLDAPRQANQLAKKIQNIERDHPHLLLQTVEEACTTKDSTTLSNKRKKTNDVNDHAPVKHKRRRKIDVLRKKYNKIHEGLDGHSCSACQHLKDESTMVSELISSASVSGALARKVRTLWAPSLRPDFLEFVILEMPKKTVWKFVADLVHFKPSDFTVPYFLADIFGESIPEDSFVYVMRQLMNAKDKDLVGTFRDVATRFPQIYKSYAFLRTKDKLIGSKEIVELLAENIPVDIAIWYFEELYRVSKKVSTILSNRLKEMDLSTVAIDNESKVFKYGKLLERILTFRKLDLPALADPLMELAGGRLGLLKEKYNDNSKMVAVFGDASSSMSTAIEAAAILAGIVSTCLDGELNFFGTGLVASPHKKPSTVEETLEICTKIRANGCTSNAASLWPYYDKKISVDTIVMVTDEGENTQCHGFYFAGLLKKYMETVNPNVKLVIVRVGQRGDPSFQKRLETNGIEATTVIIDNHRPDLTKFDALLGEIALACQADTSVDVVDEGDEKMQVDVGAEDDFVLVE